MTHYHIGHNTPGYMPDGDVWCFDGGFGEARDIVQEEAKIAADHNNSIEICNAYIVTDESNGIEAQFRVSIHPQLERVGDLDEVFWAVPAEIEDGCTVEGE